MPKEETTIIRDQLLPWKLFLVMVKHNCEFLNCTIYGYPRRTKLDLSKHAGHCVFMSDMPSSTAEHKEG